MFFYVLSFIVSNKSPIIFMTISKDIMDLIPGAGNSSVRFGAQEDYILSINSGKFRSSATSFFPKHLFLPLLLPSRFTRFFIHCNTALLLVTVVNEVRHIFVIVISTLIIPDISNIGSLTQFFVVVKVVFRGINRSFRGRRRWWRPRITVTKTS
jgi:hypothetical protein